MRFIPRTAVTAIMFGPLAAAAVALAACGGGYSSGDKTATAGAGGGASTPQATRASGSGSPAAGGGNATLSFTAKDFEFSPGDATATAGETLTVTLKNDGAATHTLTVYSDEGYTQPIAGADTGRVASGASKSVTFTVPSGGDLYFRCEVHPTQMQGEIAVE